jgi:putative transposase
MKYGVIRETAKINREYSILKMCRKLNVSRGGYYQWCKRDESSHTKQDRYLKEKINTIYEQSRNVMVVPVFTVNYTIKEFAAGKNVSNV